MGYLGQLDCKSVFRGSLTQGQGLVSLAAHVSGPPCQSQGRRVSIVTAHLDATPRCRAHKPTGNKPDIWPWDRQSPRRSAPTLNTLGSDSIAWGASQADFYDAIAEIYQWARTQDCLEIGYPGGHGLPVQHFLCNVILYHSFPLLRDRTPRTTNWEYESVRVQVFGSTGAQFILDVSCQARNTVRVIPWAWETETEWQPARRSCPQGSGNGRVRNLERFKTNSTFRVGVRY